MINHPYFPPQVCPKCGRYMAFCECSRRKENDDYLTYLQKLRQEPEPAPAIDYDILAEKVAVRIVALLGKK